MRRSLLGLVLRGGAACVAILGHLSAQVVSPNEVAEACRVIGERRDGWEESYQAMARLRGSSGLNREVAGLLAGGSPDVLLGAAVLLSPSGALPSECLVARSLLVDAEPFDVGGLHDWARCSPRTEMQRALEISGLRVKEIAGLLRARDPHFLQIELVRELLRCDFAGGELSIAEDLGREDLRQFLAAEAGVRGSVLCEEWDAFAKGRSATQMGDEPLDVQSIDEDWRAWYVAGVVEAIGSRGYAARCVAPCSDTESLSVAMFAYAEAMELAMQFPMGWWDGRAVIGQPQQSVLPQVRMALALVAPRACSPHVGEWDEGVWMALMTEEWVPSVMAASRRMGGHTRSLWGELETRCPRALEEGLRVLSSAGDESVALAAKSARCILGTATVAECVDLMVEGVRLPGVFPAHAGRRLMDVLSELGDPRSVRRIHQLSEGMKQRGNGDMAEEWELQAMYALGLPATYIQGHVHQSFELAAIKAAALGSLWERILMHGEAVSPLLVLAAGYGDARAKAEMDILHAALPAIAGSAWGGAPMTEGAGRVWLAELPNVLLWADCPEFAYRATEQYAIAMGMWCGPDFIKREDSLGPRRAWSRRVASELLGKSVAWSRLEKCWIVQ